MHICWLSAILHAKLFIAFTCYLRWFQMSVMIKFMHYMFFKSSRLLLYLHLYDFWISKFFKMIYVFLKITDIKYLYLLQSSVIKKRIFLPYIDNKKTYYFKTESGWSKSTNSGHCDRLLWMSIIRKNTQRIVMRASRRLTSFMQQTCFHC